jgi:hypothetical protein
MIKELINCKRTLNEFISYLKKQDIDITLFFKIDFRYRIGFYIEFLSIRNITICFDSFNYIVYCDKEYKDAISLLKPQIIFESDNSNITNILEPIENFKLGLIEAFKHIEQPF